MAKNTAIDLSPEIMVMAQILNRKSDEFSILLSEEFKIIQQDTFESNRYPKSIEDFVRFATEFFVGIVQYNEIYKQTLNKLIDREGPRRFYFFKNELEAISRIFGAIEIGATSLELENLELSFLPPLIKKLGKLEVLNLRGNKIQDLTILNNFQQLKNLTADSNPLIDVAVLGKNKNLEILSLNDCKIQGSFDFLLSLPKLRFLSLIGNNINDTRVLPILKIPTLDIVNLANNSLDTQPAITNDLIKLREYYNVKIESNNEDKSSQASSKERPAKEKERDEIFPTELHKTEKPVAEASSANDNVPADKPVEDKKSQTLTEAEEEEAKSFRTGKFSIMATPTDVLLDVKDLSTIFYDFIADCKYNSEQFFGLFGRWGRGKTYLWEYIKNKKVDTEKYSTVEFHAWKYQDTPGLWAYLYGELNRHYLQEGEEKKSQFGKFLLKTKNILKLNYTRGKILQPILFFIGSVFLSIILFIVDSATKLFENNNILIPSILGLITINIAVFINYLKKYWNGAKQIVSQVTSNVDFRTHLGLQHEIQEELKFLLKAWIPEKKQAKKRILLFIDDIDRCSEDKIIQIVDYIRVLLNDKEIQERVTVLAAIDERILIHAIQNKYKKFVENKDNDATFKELCREYMDKLFLAGLKLGPLTGFEKEEMVEGFTKGYLKQEKKEESTPVLQTPQPLTKEPEIKVLGKDPRSLDPGKFPSPRMVEGTFKKSDLDDSSTQENDEDIPSSTSVIQQETPADENGTIAYSLEKWEQDFLKEIMRQNTDATPRSIRVYTYRYLLGKKLIEKPLTDGKPSCDQWYNSKRAKKFFALNLFHYTYRSNVDELNSQYREFMKDYDDKKQVHMKLYNYPLSLNQELGSIMYQTLTMIVAY